MVTKYEAAERGARQGRGRGKERPNNSRKRGRAEKAGKIKGGRAGGGGGGVGNERCAWDWNFFLAKYIPDKALAQGGLMFRVWCSGFMNNESVQDGDIEDP